MHKELKKKRSEKVAKSKEKEPNKENPEENGKASSAPNRSKSITCNNLLISECNSEGELEILERVIYITLLECIKDLPFAPLFALSLIITPWRFLFFIKKASQSKQLTLLN